MSTTLSQAKQEENLESIVMVTLDNFSVTRLLANVLILYHNAGLPNPRATIYLQGQLAPASFSGTNCGIFVQPVFRMAVLDCRRSLEFFGLSCDHNIHRIVQVRNRRSDDLGVEHFGLSMVTPAQFL